MSDLNWNYSEFLTFLLIHASYADLEFTDDEKQCILEKVGEKTFNKMFESYEFMGEFERLEEIMKYKGVYFPTLDRKQELMEELVNLFNSDGEFTKLEHSLYDFLNKLL